MRNVISLQPTMTIQICVSTDFLYLLNMAHWSKCKILQYTNNDHIPTAREANQVWSWCFWPSSKDFFHPGRSSASSSQLLWVMFKDVMSFLTQSIMRSKGLPMALFAYLCYFYNKIRSKFTIRSMLHTYRYLQAFCM